MALPTMSVFISRVTEDFDLCLEATGEAEPRGGSGAACIGHGLQFDTGPACQKEASQMRWSPYSGLGLSTLIVATAKVSVETRFFPFDGN